MHKTMKTGFSFLVLILAIPTAAEAENWQGCYGGINLGAGAGKNKSHYVNPGTGAFNAVASNTAVGLQQGIQLGCDWRAQQWVLGAQGMLDASSLKGSNVFVGGSGPHDRENYRLRWVSTVAARAGYVIDDINLLYAKGGVAWAHYDYRDNDPDFPVTGSASWTAMGWLVGGGAERQLTDHISAFAEYSYTYFGKETGTVTFSNIAFAASQGTYNQNLHQVLVGVNYRF